MLSCNNTTNLFIISFSNFHILYEFMFAKRIKQVDSILRKSPKYDIHNSIQFMKCQFRNYLWSLYNCNKLIKRAKYDSQNSIHEMLVYKQYQTECKQQRISNKVRRQEQQMLVISQMDRLHPHLHQFWLYKLIYFTRTSER